jgi:hypothetical protein
VFPILKVKGPQGSTGPLFRVSSARTIVPEVEDSGAQDPGYAGQDQELARKSKGSEKNRYYGNGKEKPCNAFDRYLADLDSRMVLGFLVLMLVYFL